MSMRPVLPVSPAPTTAHDGADLREALIDALRSEYATTLYSAEGTADRLLAGPLATLTAALDAMRARAEKAERKAAAANAGREQQERLKTLAFARADGAEEGRRHARVVAETEARRSQAAEASLATAQAETTVLRARVEAVEAALKPFARAAEIVLADAAVCFCEPWDEATDVSTILPSGETPALCTLGDLYAARSTLTRSTADGR